MASSDGAESNSRELRPSKNICIEEPGDRFSILPDDIIHHIFSFISTVDAVRTSVLAKKWRHLWTRSPYIYFNDDQAPFRDRKDAFVQFVDGVLRMFKAPKVIKFSLSIKEPSNAICVDDWIHFAVLMDVDELSVELNANMTGYGPIEMPCCESVRDLRLNLGGMGLILPDTGTFSSLEVLSLSRVGLIDDAVTYTLSKQCPCLKSLNFSRCSGLRLLNVSCPLLENLGIRKCCELYQLSIFAEKLQYLSMHDSFTYDKPSSVKIFAPNIQIFDWLDYIVGEFDFGNFTSLKAACVSLVVHPSPQSKSLYLESATKSLRSLACAQILAVEIACFWDLTTNLELLAGLPTFRHNLKYMKLLVGLDEIVFRGISYLFKICPNLETLAVSITDEEMHQLLKSRFTSASLFEGDDRPVYQTRSLDRLQEASICGFGGSKHQIEFVEFLLENAVTLKRLSVWFLADTDISLGENEKASIVQKLMELKRASPNAVVVVS